MDEVQGKYKIKPFGSKSGKQRKLKHEEIDPGHYRPSARCVAFTTSEDRILFWVKALQDHYYELPSSNQSFHIKWIDHVNKDDTAFEHIELKVSHQSGQSGEHRTLLFTITVYLTTGVIMCQGSSYELWYEKEFPRLKERMDQIFDIYHGKAATNGEEDFHERVAENELTLRHLKEASELSKFNKKTKPSFEENLSEDEADETLKTKSLRNTPPSTPCFLRKRRNSVDSVRGLSTRSKASLTALKSVVADLETDFTEVKNTVSTTNDLYNGKMDILADKIAQLENTFKVKIEFLSARVIDLETNYDSLLAENVKLKNDIQNIKQLQKGTIKRVDNLEAVTNNTTFVNAARDATPAEQPETSGKNSLPNNPFNVLLTIDQENRSVQNADCRLQTADCRLQTEYKMQTRYKMQTADCRLGTKCRLTFETVFSGFLFYIISFDNLPAVIFPFRMSYIPRKLSLPENDLAPLLKIYFLNEVSKINSFLNMI